MRIGPTPPQRAIPGGKPPAGARQVGTGVVTVEPVRAGEGPRLSIPRRPEAALVAQLLAIRDDHPQTRARRRADPREAAQAYGARRPAAPGGRLDLTA